jgi:tetratricopeptide (TPR) repeat protein
MKKAVTVLLILAVVTLGAMHGHYSFLKSSNRIDVGFWDYLMGNYKELTPQTRIADAGEDKTDKAAEPADEGGEPAPKAVRETKKEEAVAVEEIKPKAYDAAAVKRLVEEGRDLYKKSEYKTAKKRFDDAIGVLEKAGHKSSELYKEAEKYSKRSRVFNALVSNIPCNDLSDGRDLFIITFERDASRKITARVLSNDGDKVKIQQNGGITSELPTDEIGSIEPVSPADYRSKLIKEYKTRADKADSKACYEVFGVALFAIQNRLRDVITSALERTFSIPRSEQVLEVFYAGGDTEEVVVALLESFDKHEEARQYKEKLAAAERPAIPEPIDNGPEPDPGPLAGPVNPEPDEQPVEPVQPEPVRPSGPTGSKAARMDEASKYFALGRRFANYATRNPARRDFYGKKAQVELEKSRDILNVLLDENPDDMEVERELQQVSDLLQFVIHNLVGAN